MVVAIITVINKNAIQQLINWKPIECSKANCKQIAAANSMRQIWSIDWMQTNVVKITIAAKAAANCGICLLALLANGADKQKEE